MDQQGPQEDIADEQDDGEIFDVMSKENRTSDPSGEPASPAEVDEPVEPPEGGASLPQDRMPNPGPPLVEHGSSYFGFSVLQKFRSTNKDPMIRNYPQVPTQSLVDYMALVAYWDFRIQPAKFDSCLLYTSPSPRDLSTSRMPSSA